MNSALYIVLKVSQALDFRMETLKAMRPRAPASAADEA